MHTKESIIHEIDEMPDTFLEEILVFIRFVKKKASATGLETALISELSLKKDWLKPEEDEAWEEL